MTEGMLYFKWLINDDNTGIETEDGVANQGMTNTICEEVHEALGGTKCGKATGRIKYPWKHVQTRQQRAEDSE